jgi:hypothetical protein
MRPASWLSSALGATPRPRRLRTILKIRPTDTARQALSFAAQRARPDDYEELIAGLGFEDLLREK